MKYKYLLQYLSELLIKQKYTVYIDSMVAKTYIKYKTSLVMNTIVNTNSYSVSTVRNTSPS